MNLVVVVGGECLEGGVAGLEGDVPVEGIGEGGGFSGGLDADVGERSHAWRVVAVMRARMMVMVVIFMAFLILFLRGLFVKLVW